MKAGRTGRVEACAVAAMLFASAAQAEESMEEVDLLQLLNVEVSTATKTAESLDDAPAIITVITAEEIARWGYQSVGEALQHVLGFYLPDDHIIPNVGVRGVTGGLGAESGVIKVMIDGASVAYRSTSGNWLGVELIPLGAVQQIEIIRGPASALYGADAFLGVVNIITVSPGNIPLLDARGHGSMLNGNLGGQFEAVGGSTVGDFDLLLGVAGERKDRSGLHMPEESPAPTIPAYNAGRTESQDLARKSFVGHARLGYRVEDSGHFVLSATASGIERGGDFAHWAQLSAGVDDAGRSVGTVVSLGQLRLTGNGLLQLTDSLQLSLLATYFQGGVLSDDRIEVASDLFWVKRQLGYQGGDGTLEMRWIPRSDFNLIVGAETVVDREDKPQPIRVSKETGLGLGSPAEQQSVTLTNLGAFISSNYQLLDPWLKLTAGARYDQHSIYGSQLTGRLGATSRWSDALVTKLLYGSAFKAPSPYLLYAQPLRPGDVIGNEELEPQRVDTFEAQASYKPSQLFEGTTGVSYSIVQDKAEFTPEGINQTAQNIASQRAISWETRIDSNYNNLVRGYGAFELLASERDLGQGGYAQELLGDRAVGYPRWIARAGVSFDVANPQVPLQASLQGIVVGPRPATDTSVVENAGHFELPPYLLLNATLATPKLLLIPGHETTFALRGKNLLGAEGPDPGFSGYEYPLAPREILLEFRHTY